MYGHTMPLSRCPGSHRAVSGDAAVEISSAKTMRLRTTAQTPRAWCSVAAYSFACASRSLSFWMSRSLWRNSLLEVGNDSVFTRISALSQNCVKRRLSTKPSSRCDFRYFCGELPLSGVAEAFHPVITVVKPASYGLCHRDLEACNEREERCAHRQLLQI